MPRHADHDARRRLLVDATLDIALKEGMNRVSVPRVAAGAGVSVGLVQHYFPAKAELVETAYQALATQADSRIARSVQTAEDSGGTIREMVPEALAELLPLDPARTAEARVRAEFTAMALRDEALATVSRGLRRSITARLRAAIDNGRTCGETDPAVDSSAAAHEFAALTDGLSYALLFAGDPDECRRAMSLLNQLSARIFTGVCRRASASPR